MGKRLEELLSWDLTTPSIEIYDQVKQNWDNIAKPLDSMGKFEIIISKIGAILNNSQPSLNKKMLLVFCADNGVVEEGISQSGQEVTAIVAKSMGVMESNVCKMVETAHADMITIDIGMNCREQFVGVRNNKVAYGTKNFMNEPAMTKEEMVKAITIGMDVVKECKERGFSMIATGEMGIGNTTTSSAVASALLHEDPVLLTGKGAGLSDRGLRKKCAVITDAIQKYDLYNSEAEDILRTVGGFDIAGMVGVFLGGAKYHIPIVIDGLISLTAALVAERMKPGAREFMIASHIGKEPAMTLLTQELQLNPVLAANMALGEGTGAVMMFSLLDMAMSVYQQNQNRTFSDIHIDPYTRQ